MKRLGLLMASAALSASATMAAVDGFLLRHGEPVTVTIDEDEAPVVGTALDLLRGDILEVLSSRTEVSAGGDIVIGTAGASRSLEIAGVDIRGIAGRAQAFLLEVDSLGRLVVAGGDARGTAYGIMELSRLLGVSPWRWWADSAPGKRDSLYLPAGYRVEASPSVEYRGIFLNDEDFCLVPWCRGFEPSDTPGRIGPRTHERVFELLLRLRANLFWPAMHGCSVPFYLTEGNKEAAERYGIAIGTSHCEPMMRNTNGEWGMYGVGEYDYVSNRENVLAFWEERVREVASMDNVYTLGMRGVHDGPMNGAGTVGERLDALAGVIRDQREMLSRLVDPDVGNVPQVFIPYKEVLDVYEAGLEVPDDVTLMWTDDNYGYVRHFPTEAERARKGGNGLYYHVSYWGRPHDYLWLATTSPHLMFQQLSLAWDRGTRRMWVVNVGDIKPGEYLTECFLDLAWDIEGTRRKGADGHLRDFLAREFGREAADSLLPVLKEHYRLAYVRRPEFMGGTRTEESDPAFSVVSDLPWGEGFIRERLDACSRLRDAVDGILGLIPPERRDGYFQLVEYPVKAAALMNEKLLTAQLARHGLASWDLSDAAYDGIAELTRRYNSMGGGKWRGMMDMAPRGLPVFARVERSAAAGDLPGNPDPVLLRNGADFDSGAGTPLPGLGHGEGAVALGRGAGLGYGFGPLEADSVDVELRLLPSHPVEGGSLRVSVSLDGSSPVEVPYQTHGRSEEWKENVLRNQAVRRLRLPLGGGGSHLLEIAAMDEGVVLDQVLVLSPTAGAPSPGN